MELLIQIVAPIATAFAAWIFSARKEKARAKQAELSNFEIYVSANRMMLEDLKAQISELTVANRELKEKIEHLEKYYPCQDCPRRLS